MEKKSPPCDDLNVLEKEFSWINSDLYHFQEGDARSSQDNTVFKFYDHGNFLTSHSNRVISSGSKYITRTKNSADPKNNFDVCMIQSNSNIRQGPDKNCQSEISNSGLKNSVCCSKDIALGLEERMNVYESRIPYSLKGHLNQIPICPNISARNPVLTKITKQFGDVVPENSYLVNLYIETKDSHLGPFPFEIYPKMNIRLLKLQVEKELGIPLSSQKWILSNTLSVDDDTSLSEYGVIPSSPIFLYINSNCERDVDIRQLSRALQRRNSALNKNKASEVFTYNNFDQPSIKSIDRRNVMNIEAVKALGVDSSLNDFLKNEFSKTTATEVSEVRKDSSSKPSSDGCTSFIGLKSCEINLECEMPLKNFKAPKAHKKKCTKVGKQVFDPLFSEIRGKEKSNLSNDKTINTVETVVGAKCSLKNGASNDISQHNADYMNIVSSDCNNLVNLFSNGSVDSKFAIIEDSYVQFSKLKKSQALECLKNDFNLINLQNPEVHSIIDNERSLSKTKRSILQQVKSKQKGRQIKDSNNFVVNESSYIEDEVLNVKAVDNTCEDIHLPEVINCISQEYVLSHGVLVERSHNEKVFDHSCKILQIKSDGDTSKELQIKETLYSNFVEFHTEVALVGDISEDIENVKNSEENAKESPITSDDVSKESQFTEISIENVSDNSLLETYIECTETKNNYESSNIVEDLQKENEEFDQESALNYEFLLRMENLNLVKNVVHFTCPICFGEFESDQGVVLHECLHTFCLDCLARSVEYAEEALVKCPYRDDLYSCQSYLQQREIKALVPADMYERYLQRSITTAESLAEKSFHCKSPDCPGWCMFEDNINVFHCPVCFHYNCLNCMAIHEGLNCRQYQDQLKCRKKMDPDSEKTLQFLNKMIDSGKAMKCPKCDLILMKKWGCDWLKCSVCLTEICWITKGPRWGPAGQGDTSAGCRCGVNGVKCHTLCTYCH